MEYRTKRSAGGYAAKARPAARAARYDHRPERHHPPAARGPAPRAARLQTQRGRTALDQTGFPWTQFGDRAKCWCRADGCVNFTTTLDGKQRFLQCKAEPKAEADAARTLVEAEADCSRKSRPV